MYIRTQEVLAGQAVDQANRFARLAREGALDNGDTAAQASHEALDVQNIADETLQAGGSVALGTTAETPEL